MTPQEFEAEANLAGYSEQYYFKQLDEMERRLLDWRTAHPDLEALISFNYPPFVAFVKPISKACEQGLVLTNEAGLDLLKFLWPWDLPSEPTVLMVQLVLEKQQNELPTDKI